MVLERTAGAAVAPPAGSRAERLARRMPWPAAGPDVGDGGDGSENAWGGNSKGARPQAGPDPFAPDVAVAPTALEQPETEPAAPIVAIRRVEVHVSRKVSKDFGSTEYAVALDADLAGSMDDEALAATVDGLYETCKGMIRRQFAGANTNNTAQKGQTT